MQRSNVEPRRSWAMTQQRAAGWDEQLEDSFVCLSCGRFTADEPFCGRCRERSSQRMLDEWDDLGVGD